MNAHKVGSKPWLQHEKHTWLVVEPTPLKNMKVKWE